MSWIWHMCFTSMKQRGVRTCLTILGVVIGVISIVSLLAIGIGMKKELLSTIESTGSITEITIYGVSEGTRKDKMITERKLDALEEIEYVETVYPQLSLQPIISYKHYTGYTEIIGVPDSYLAQIELANGEKPDEMSIKPELLMGKNVMNLFFNENSGVGYTEGKEDEVVDMTGEKMDVQFSMDNNAETYHLEVTGMTKNESYCIYCDMDVLKKYLKRITTDGKIPGQPVNENDENYNEWIYDSAIVKVDDAEHVEKVLKTLQDMGFETENNKELLDSVQKEMKTIQLMLGGVGMIALIVAVIGIGNTMTTAVYDRINEIGILKVLGCDPDELLYLFLLESGILGAIGGIVGILASYGISEFFINKVAIKLLDMPKGTELAVIPLWLAIVAFIFAVVLGVGAGYFPARWASKMKPIEAVRK